MNLELLLNVNKLKVVWDLIQSVRKVIQGNLKIPANIKNLHWDLTIP